MPKWCVDDRHGVPCPKPCAACAESCEPTDEVEAVDSVDAMRQAGWSENYIASVPQEVGDAST